MTPARAAETTIALQCELIWQESGENHVCGLLEEAVEVAHASGFLSKADCAAKLMAMVERVYAKPIPDDRQRPAELHGELVDLTVMCSVVRQHTEYMSNEPLLDAGLDKIQRLYLKSKRDPDWFTSKTEDKVFQGLRFPKGFL